MKRQLVILWAIFFAALLCARGEGPDDKYVQVYNLIQEADALNDSGRTREAAAKYFEAEKALKALQADYPDWNGNVVKFRLAYIASKLEPLGQKLPGTNAPAVIVATEPRTIPSETNQFKELQEEIKRLTAQNGLLEARLKEALSVQPAQLDPRELAKAEEQIKALQKERDLLKVSLEQEKSKTPKPVDPALLDQERQIVV